MESWVKALIMFAVTAVWAAVMIGFVFVRHVDPSYLYWTIPGAVYVSVYHGLPTRFKDPTRPDDQAK